MMKDELIAGKLYDIRDATKRLIKGYDSRIRIYIKVLETVMEKNKCSASEALIMISKTTLYKKEDETRMLYISACVEIMTREEEPEEEP